MIDIPQPQLAASYAYCQHITRTQARNFYYGLKLLPEPKRSAMYALYAYMRLVDDIADDESFAAQSRSDLLTRWQEHTHTAINATAVSALPPNIKLWPAFAHMVQTYRIPTHLFDDMIAGQRQDLTPHTLDTFQQLKDYCYRVASVVGLASLYVWGFDDTPAVHQLAIDRGIAFQLTNILRDVREDAARGRCYYPVEHLQQFNLTPADLTAASTHPRLLDFLNFQIATTDHFYTASEPLKAHVHKDARPTLFAMTAIYRGILQKIAKKPTAVLHQRISLSTLSKMLIAYQAMRL